MKADYFVGVFWILMACLVSASNDMVAKISGMHLSGVNVLFFRFLFSTLVLLPFVIFRPHRFATKNLGIHALRGGLFALAMLPWCYGLIALPLPMVTTLSFTTPLFVILLAQIFLKESVGWRRLGATLIGFIGIIIGAGLDASTLGLNKVVGLALLATFLFAVLDILNKRLLNVDEAMGPMVLFSSVWTTIFTLPLAVMNWQTPNLQELAFLALLGASANLLLWCLLKASASYDLSALQPFRYSEFLFSCILSILVFHEWPTSYVVAGMALLVPATFYLSHHELKLAPRALTLILLLTPFASLLFAPTRYFW